MLITFSPQCQISGGQRGKYHYFCPLIFIFIFTIKSPPTDRLTKSEITVYQRKNEYEIQDIKR